MAQSHMALSFNELDPDDIDIAGQEAIRLSQLTQAKVGIPTGFVIPTTAYFRFLKENFLTTKITHLLGTVNYEDPHSLLQVASHIRKVIFSAELPEEIQRDVVAHYRLLGGALKDPPVMLSISTPGTEHPKVLQQKKYFQGDSTFVLGIKTLWASQFDAKTLLYRHRERADHFHSGIAIIVQQQPPVDVSGIIYTSNPLQHTKDEITIEAVYGLSDSLYEKSQQPDLYILQKSDLKIQKKDVSEQEVKLELIQGELHHVAVQKTVQKRQKLSDEELVHLSQMAKTAEKLFYFSQRIVWQKSGKQFVIVATTDYHGDPEDRTVSEPFVIGTSSYGAITSGKIKVINHPKDIPSVASGDILVTERLTAELTPAFKKVAGIITERSVDTASALRLRSKVSIPLIAGVKKARQLFNHTQVVTLNGKAGAVFRGGFLSPVPHDRKQSFASSATKLYVSITEHPPKEIAALPTDSVGIISGDSLIEAIGVHPKKMLRDGKGEAFSLDLAERIEAISIAAHPRPLIYAMANLTTDRYRKLSGGKSFEPVESNPHLGFYGGLRALHDPEAFELELAAVVRVRNSLPGKNLGLMLPIARSPQEFFRMKKLVIAAGLSRSATLRLWFRLALPANVVRVEEFLSVGLDGVLIDAERLTEFFLGTDSLNPEVSHALSHDDETLLQAAQHIIKRCQKLEVPAVYSARHPSPTTLKQLIAWGVSGVCVEPYALENVRKTIYNYERQLVG